MIVQGSGLPISIENKSRRYLRGADNQKAPVPQKMDLVEISETAQERSELLKKIKEKINSGFYNSESVLDDLSHGFAKTLDIV